MKQQDNLIKNSPLSLLLCGVYISSFELQSIAANASIKIEAKSRQEMLKEIYDKADTNYFHKELMALIDKKLCDYAKLKAGYTESAKLISNWEERAERAKRELSVSKSL